MSNKNSNQQMPMAGAKRQAPEEEKGGTLDVRKLVGRFRSKADIYDYLLH
jgi:hypothetical protein